MEIDYSLIGQRIAKRRKVLNLTQDDVAETTGLSNNFISNIENNHSIPSIETLMKICEALNATPDYFLLGVYKNIDENMLIEISEKLKLCNDQKQRLISNFITWIIDENI
jgi:transcriptional regulator with XRE-family HTH domain